MKYNAKQIESGDWAVFTGSKYFINYICDTEAEAKKMALKLSAQWYYLQAESAYSQAEKEGLLDEYDGFLGDWLC